MAILASLGLLGLVLVGLPDVAAAGGPIVSLGDASGLERDTTTGSVFVPVFLSEPSDQPVVVTFHSVDGTAVGGLDYQTWGTVAAPRSITVPAGALQATINVPIAADSLTEPDEDLSIVVDEVSGGDASVGDGSGTATIVDADGLAGPNPVLTVSSGAVHEGDSGQRRAQFLVHLSRAQATPLTLGYTTSADTATAGDDFVPKLPGSIVFAPGQISKTIDVLVNADTVDDVASRTFSLALAVLGGPPVEELHTIGTATIVDDDEPPVTTTTTTTEPLVPTAVQVAAGGDHTCARMLDGTVRCWGNGADGRLGNGSTTGSSVPEEVPGLTAVVDLAAGFDHTCAVRDDGSAWCWGDNSGALGNGSSVDSTIPVQVTGLADAVSVRAGTGYSCALRSSGTVSCWGANSSGQLGNGTNIASNVPTAVVGVTSASSISTGATHGCALGGGNVRCWGANSYGQAGSSVTGSPVYVPVVVPDTSDALAVSAGQEHTCVIAKSAVFFTATISRPAKCWGRNDSGVFGVSSSSVTTSSTPLLVTVGLGVPSSYGAVASGDDYACASQATGLLCWGRNSQGQLGRGTTSNSSSPTSVSGLTSAVVVGVGTGPSHACAVTDSGWVVCWGQNTSGKLGNGTTTSTTKPVLAISGTGTPPPAATTTTTTTTTAPTTTTSTTTTLPPVADPAQHLGVGVGFACAATASSVHCWGRNHVGQLGNGTATDSWVATPVSGLGAVSDLVAGSSHSCALADGEVWCWGDNGEGQLGNGGTATATSPQKVSGLSGIVDLDAGGRSTCAIDATASLWCWGWNYWGTVGDGTTTDALSPVLVAGLPPGVDDVAVGDSHVCAALDGAAWCWGKNEDKELGNGSVVASLVPVQVSGLSDATAVGVGDRHSCAVVTTGVKCWGNNSYGQIGVSGMGTTVASPTSVVSLGPVTELAGGNYTNCAVGAAGFGHCWGYNVLGQVGDGTSATATSAKQVIGLTAVTKIDNQGLHTCAISSGRVFCVGHNEWGQLGNGTAAGLFTGSFVPVQVLGLE